MPRLPYPPDILGSLERPGRYLGTELNSGANQIPDSQGRLLRIALAFPDVYEIAHSHLGHKILYGLFNSTPGFSAERVYAPWFDLERRLRQSGTPLKSLESGAPVRDFGVVGFTLQYELGYTNILNMLELSGLPLRARDRDSSHPLIVGGGPGAANPEPLAPFFDVFFLGDAEAGLLADYAVISDSLSRKEDRPTLFQRLSVREGIYVPSLYTPRYGESLKAKGYPPFAGTEGPPGAPPPRAAKVLKLSGAYFPRAQILPLVKPVHDRVAVEIARGCSRGCRFCQAGYLYRPVRERGAEEILRLMEENLSATGQDEAAFLALSAGDHSSCEPLVQGFMDRFQGKRVSLSLPSLRVKSLSRSLAWNIKRVRKTGFTIAPEAGTERLRAVINKDLTEDDIFNAVRTAADLGWKTLKLYFMCGLPTETDEDLEAAAELSRALSRMAKVKISVGLSHFSPKARTPFQWREGSTIREIERRLSYVKDRAAERRILIRRPDAGGSFAEALVSRGDRRMADVLELVFRKGARFEAWNDRFRVNLWEEALDELKIPLEPLLKSFSPDSPLPWDHVSYGVEKSFLLRELELALRGERSPDCRLAGCRGCGVCRGDLKIDVASPASLAREKAALRLSAGKAEGSGFTPPAEKEEVSAAAPYAEAGEAPPPAGGSAAEAPAPQTPVRPGKIPPAAPYAGYSLRFQKIGPSIYIGHLELMELFKRAFRRAGFSLSYSKGFHPQPNMSFLTALPLGLESLDERLQIRLEEPVPPGEIIKRLELPAGLTILSAHRLPEKGPKIRLKGARWMAESERELFCGVPEPKGAVLAYLDHKGRERRYPIDDHVENIKALSPRKATLDIIQNEKGSPRPLNTFLFLWKLPPDSPLALRKLETLIQEPPSPNPLWAKPSA
ncbi:MAG: TIGR03960 family B12-binding radical SAM protein [Deltaproteobacteria bacterium]|jgi:radical SAM family uncharacterized protein/radical SAM-linked protein|nr:TIGR03960 family B12-binding radical SAM protein [Deltaproteobacteria bacterium]